MADKLGENEVRAWLEAMMRSREGDTASERLPSLGRVADESTKWRIVGCDGTPVPIAIGSSAMDPGQTARAVANLRAARAALSRETRQVVLSLSSRAR